MGPLGLLPDSFLHDLLLSLAGYAYFWACVVLFALLLQIQLSAAQRHTAGLFITSALLVGLPFVIYSPTQTYGIGLASIFCLGAWSLFFWTFNSSSKRPSVLEVCCSMVTHPMAGMIKVHKRMQQHQHRLRASTAGEDDDAATTATGKPNKSSMSRRRTLVVDVDATGGTNGHLHVVNTAKPAAQEPSLLPPLLGAVASLISAAIFYDVGLYTIPHRRYVPPVCCQQRHVQRLCVSSFCSQQHQLPGGCGVFVCSGVSVAPADGGHVQLPACRTAGRRLCGASCR